VSADQLINILAAVGASPVLPGARCRGRHHLFDEAGEREAPETAAQRHQQALGLCRLCPARAACETWCDSLTPAARPPGVIAGRIEPRPARPTQKKEDRMTTPDAGHDDDDEETREFVQRLFAGGDPGPPADIVDRGAARGLTRETLLRQNELVGWRVVDRPGEILVDPDGLPVGVGQSERILTYATTAVTSSRLAALGLKPADVPNLTVMDDPQPKEKP
jgi:WhiB family redox-sensing transcriptional regulator